MRVLSTLPWFVLIAVAEAGYYKIRPPAPPPPPPGSVHYGPHPPPAKYHRPSPHHYPPPPPPHYPKRYHRPRSPIASPSNRYYQRYPAPPQKLAYPPQYSWKNYNTFQAPIIKETFSTPQSTYVPNFFKDDDKGPIHTIPAPNLGPIDAPVSHIASTQFEQQDYLQQKKPLHSTDEDLFSVLKHGITKVNVQNSPGYQVTEDPSLHQPHSGHASYFAPDPDPEVPALKIPPTTDPHSFPSNGQIPLDLYLQKEAEKNSGHVSQPSGGSSDKLTAQELFNLLNYDPANPVGLIPQAQLQQHVLQPNIQFYNPLLVPQTSNIGHSHNILAQQSHQQFAPQYQTFNYDEQTQQGAYGSNSFPASSMNLNLHGSDDYSQNHDDEDKHTLYDNDVEGSENINAYDRVSENEIINPRPEERKILPSSREVPSNIKNKGSNNQAGSETSSYHSTTIPLQVSGEKPNIEENRNTETSNKQTAERPIQTQNEPSPVQNSLKPDNNVQLHKSIQIYENTYSANDDLIQQEIKNLNEFGNDYTDEERIVKSMAIGQPIAGYENRDYNQENVQSNDSVAYGTRIRPKRF